MSGRYLADASRPSLLRVYEVVVIFLLIIVLLAILAIREVYLFYMWVSNIHKVQEEFRARTRSKSAVV